MYSIDRLKNNLFAWYLAWFFVFGVVFYDYIQSHTGFSFTDEIAMLVLFCFALFPRKERINKRDTFNLFLVLGIFVFWFIYSMKIGSNNRNAILTDFLIQIKPFLAFYCTILIAPNLTGQKKWLGAIVLCFVPLLFLDRLVSGLMGETSYFFGHVSRYATTAIIISYVYLYASPKSKPVPIRRFVLLLSLGLLSWRSKMYAFWVISVLVLCLFRRYRFQWNFKTGLILSIGLCTILVLSYGKLNFYFIEGTSDPDNMFARPALYEGAKVILGKYKYFPLGSGYASYATHASAQFYSKLYYELDLAKIHGLTPDKPSFMSDTFFPSLAQFGIAGILLFSYFWFSILRKANFYRSHIRRGVVLEYTFVFLIFIFFMIESTADSTFTQNRGIFMMTLLALCMTDLRRQYENPMEANDRRMKKKKNRHNIFVHPGYPKHSHLDG